MIEHSNEVHGEPKPFKCQYCNFKTDIRKILTAHIKTHSKTGDYGCQECGRKFRDKRSLHHHQVTKPGAEGLNIFCQCCGKIFKTNKQYKIHKSQTQTMQPVQCKECGKTFINKAKHTAHMNNSHPTETFSCELCGWVSKTKEALKVHQVLGCQKIQKQQRNITTGP